MMTDDLTTPADEPKAPEMVTEASAETTDTVTAETQPEAPPVAELEVAELPAAAEPEEAKAEMPAESVSPAAEEEAEREPLTAEQDLALFEAAMNSMTDTEDIGEFKRLSKGDRVEATVVQVERDRVFVDLGTKSEGIVPLEELADGELVSAEDHVKVGDKIHVIVLRPEGSESGAIVSKKRADFEVVWDNIERAFKEGTVLSALVTDRVKGGLVVDVGVRGFVPATHVGSGKLRNIEKYVGQSIPLKVIEIDRDRKKVVLSNRQAEDEKKEKARDNIFGNVNPGDILDGTVRRLTDYGAFVDLGGVDGLLHISEMSWARINHPKEMFKEGQKIQVMVLRLDAAAGKISLGHRQVLPDPWNLIRQNYTVGQRFTCKISRLVQSGAFIRLPEGAEAFLPVSEMSIRRVRRPEDVVTEAQDVEVQVLDLRPDERRMVLSMRAIGGGAEPSRVGPGGTSAAPEFDDDRGGGDKRKKKTGKKGGRRDREDEDFDVMGSRRGFTGGGGATIGERLGMLKGFLGREDEEDEAEVEVDVDADVEVEIEAPVVEEVAHEEAEKA